MADAPRRSSKLGADNPFEPPPRRTVSTPKEHDDQDVSEVADQEKVEKSPPTEPSRPTPAGAPVSRNARRLTVHKNVSDEDMVSFNCKMSRGLRRAVRHYAADVEVDIQDVVAAALVDYLQARDRAVPAFELQEPD